MVNLLDKINYIHQYKTADAHKHCKKDIAATMKGVQTIQRNCENGPIGLMCGDNMCDIFISAVTHNLADRAMGGYSSFFILPKFPQN